jgi:hypothetical protein
MSYQTSREIVQSSTLYHQQIEGKGHHIGRFKGFALDANDSLIIETDIDSLSCTK